MTTLEKIERLTSMIKIEPITAPETRPQNIVMYIFKCKKCGYIRKIFDLSTDTVYCPLCYIKMNEVKEFYLRETNED